MRLIGEDHECDCRSVVKTKSVPQKSRLFRHWRFASQPRVNQMLCCWNASENFSQLEARASCLQALQLAERLGMRPLVVRCLLTLARLHERAVATATDFRARAARLAAEQGMSLALLESAGCLAARCGWATCGRSCASARKASGGL